MKGLRVFIKQHIQTQNLLLAFPVTFILEVFGRRSLYEAFSFMVQSPVTFFCNLFIVFLSLSVSVLAAPRQRFARNMISLFWMICGIVNMIVLRYRMTPFSAGDLHMVPSLLRIADNYLTGGGAFFVIASLVLVIVGIVFMWFRSPKDTVRIYRLREIVKIASFTFGLSLLLGMGTYTEAISTDFQNLADAYEEYGFAYCFSTSIVDVGISKPEGYSNEAVASCAEQIRQVSEQNPQWWNGNSVHPNIVMVQLESFIDPSYINNTGYSSDPIPYMRSLAGNYASGYFKVPVVGAGTANTEFEVLSGMSVGYFGAGEYPYNTVLKTTTAETAAHILRSYGYTSSAIHNNTGTFYNRDTVFSMMGFDRFIPGEYLYEEEFTPNHWMKDKCLTNVIADTLASSEGRDFIYTITVQSHGRYPEEQVLDDPAIRVTDCPETISRNALEYYVNEIREVDAFVEDLVSSLSSFEEPVVLVLYGDHLPALGFEEEDLSLPDLYRTEYVIWNNFGDNIPDRELSSCEITGYLLRRYGLAGGILPLAHAAVSGDEEKDAMLEMLEYDMLYGEGYIFDLLEKEPAFSVSSCSTENGKNRGYRPEDMEIGYLPITLERVENRDGIITVYGSNFNRSSVILIDGVCKETQYLNRQTLCLKEPVKDTEQIEQISVGQFDENRKQIGEASNSLPLFSFNSVWEPPPLQAVGNSKLNSVAGDNPRLSEPPADRSRAQRKVLRTERGAARTPRRS